MRVNCSIEYVPQSAYGLCPYLNAAVVPALGRCLANQHSTFSGIRANETAAESFLDMGSKPVLIRNAGNLQ
jgi:hypothetical protein